MAANVFLNGGVFSPSVLRTRAGHGPGREDIYIVHNGQLRAEPGQTPRSLRGIASRVLATAGRAAVVGDLFRIYSFGPQEQADFQWVTIAQDVQLEGAEVFDPVKMRELYDIGYRAARAGPEWAVRPPGFQADPPGDPAARTK